MFDFIHDAFTKKICTTVVVTTLTSPLIAGEIDVPPLTNSSLTVAANEPDRGNVWTGLGQSFVAEDPNILFGFYTIAFPAINDATYLFSLYAGDGVFSTPLLEVSTDVTQPDFSVELVEVDLTTANLTPGNSYTVVISLPGQMLPALDSSTDLSVVLNSTDNGYTAGRAYFLGSSFDQNLPVFANRDLAFKVTPVVVEQKLDGGVSWFLCCRADVEEEPTP